MSKPVPTQFRRKIEDIEAGAYYTAAEVLLIGLKHIRKHRMGHPIGLTPEQWFDEIVPELIWLCEAITGDEWSTGPEFHDRYHKAEQLLGAHFSSIWC